MADTEDETSPVPAELVALTRKLYVVPLVRSVTVAEVDVDVPSANVDQDPAPSSWYSMT
jgi:hypothetical protein